MFFKTKLDSTATEAPLANEIIHVESPTPISYKWSVDTVNNRFQLLGAYHTGNDVTSRPCKKAFPISVSSTHFLSSMHQSKVIRILSYGGISISAASGSY